MPLVACKAAIVESSRPMNPKTVTITLPAKRLKFIDEYRKAHSLKGRSEVIEMALSLLQEAERESEMSEAPEEDDLSGVDLDVGRDRDERGD